MNPTPAGAPTPILTAGDAAAYAMRSVGRGGRVHYAHASACLTAATGRPVHVAQRPSGRPRLSGGGPELGVSLSWREGLLLVGYSPVAAIGVDIEPDDMTLDPLALARDHFAAGEARAIAAQNSHDAQRDLFLRLWVAKEAVLKATGRGVYDGLDEPDLSSLLPELAANGRAFAVGASTRVPAGQIAVRAFAAGEGPALYAALARIG